jgi:hypothetical protein
VILGRPRTHAILEDSSLTSISLQRSPSTLESPFTRLPADLFPQILHHLDYADILAVKFVCRDFNANTSLIDPRVFARKHAQSNPRTVPRRDLINGYTTIEITREDIINTEIRAWREKNVTLPIIKLEALELKPLALLTCSECGIRKGLGVGSYTHEFSKEAFVQKDIKRRCERCRRTYCHFRR